MRQVLDALLRPCSVALIGASANPKKLSHVVLKNLMDGKFRLYPVNPNAETILGLKCYASALEIPGSLDLAVISLPAHLCVEPLEECVEKGARVAVVTSSGFRETGPSGAKLEGRLLEAIRGTQTRILGPNTMGAFVPSVGLDTHFISKVRSPRPGPGSIAMLSQSGAVSVSFLERAVDSGSGISACIGLGNKCDINENDLLAYFGSHSSTHCIAMYLESLSNGRKFVELAKDITRRKPVVVLKAGRTSSGLRAASSHSGALAAATDAVVTGALKQSGVERAFDEEELLDLAKASSCLGSIGGDRICIVASAGGYGVIATDLIESKERGAGMRMAALSRETVRTIESLIPDYGSATNPVDLTAGVTDEMYDRVLGALQEDGNVDAIMMSLELQPPLVTNELVRVAETRAKTGETPLVACVFGGERTAEVMRELEKRGVPAYPTLWRSIRALRALADRGEYLSRLK